MGGVGRKLERSVNSIFHRYAAAPTLGLRDETLALCTECEGRPSLNNCPKFKQSRYLLEAADCSHSGSTFRTKASTVNGHSTFGLTFDRFKLLQTGYSANPYLVPAANNWMGSR